MKIISGRRALALSGLVIALALAGAAITWYTVSWRGVVARVNGDPITERELKRVMNDPVVQQQAQAQQDDASQAANPVERFALRRLIFAHLMLGEAARRELKLTDQDIDQARAALRARFKDDESFAEWRKTKDVADDATVTELLRQELLVSRVASALTQDAKLDDGAVEAYYEEHKARFEMPEMVRLQMIAVPDRKSGDEIAVALRKGADFATLAKERSQGFRAAEGGELGWVSAERLRPAVRQTVARMKPGQTKGPVKTESGFLILRLVDHRAARARALEELRADIEEHLLRVKREEIVMGWLAEQEKRAKIRLAAK